MLSTPNYRLNLRNFMFEIIKIYIYNVVMAFELIFVQIWEFELFLIYLILKKSNKNIKDK